MNIGFIGLGRMGIGMVESLLRAGHTVTVYNRTASKADPLVAKGAKLAVDPAGVCHGDVVITMLADDEALEEVTFGERGILTHLRKDAIHLSASTVSVALAERLTEEHKSLQQHFVSAPVFGRPQVAADGKLNIIVAGAAEPVQRVTPVLEAMSQKVWPVGQHPRDANLFKISGNYLLFSAIQAMSETVALLEKGGVDKRVFLEMMTSTLFASPIYKNYGASIVDEKYSPPGFTAALALKDMRLALAAGDSLQVPLPTGSLIRDQYLALMARGGEDLDASALGKVAAENSGLRKS